MNNTRRNALESIRSKCEELLHELEQLQGEEQDTFDALPDSLQQSEKGEAMEAAAAQLDEAVSYMVDVVASIDAARCSPPSISPDSHGTWAHPADPARRSPEPETGLSRQSIF